MKVRLGRPTDSAFEEFQHDRLGFLKRCAEAADVMDFRFGADDVMVLSRPELVHDVLVTKRADFSKAYLTSVMHPLLANSLLLADSDSWLHQRKLALPAFHRERFESYAAIMAAEARRVAARWASGEVRDIHSEMMRMTLRVVTRTLFGIDLKEAVGVAERLIALISDEFNRRIASPVRFRFPLPSLRTVQMVGAMRELDALAYRAIRERRESPQDDLLSMLVTARDEAGDPMTDREVRDACIAVFFAGHETTACLLSWTWYVLSSHPEVEATALDELGRQNGELATSPATLVELLPYLQHILDEVLRVYPPAYAFGRRAVRPTAVGGRAVPEGTTVLMSPWAMHRNPAYFDQPDRFLPERWTNGLASRLPRFAYFPFSSGPRRCIGSSFATMEATIAIAVILPMFRLSSTQAVEPAPSLTLRPDGPMPMRISSRQG